MSLEALRKHWRPVAAVVAGLAVLVGGIVFLSRDDGGNGPTSPAGTQGAGTVGTAAAGGFGVVDLLRIRLSEGQAFPAALSRIPAVEGTVLSDDEVGSVLARLPELESEPDDRQDFNRPADSLPPPLVGDTVETAFPPPAPIGTERAGPTSGPLEVVRFQPEGEVAVAPFLSVTFNQPMVELTTLDQLREIDIPVTIEPAVEGRWRWIGTRTLRFELEPGPIDRLPAATDYTVTIPAGTRSASGAELAQAVAFTFATPAPQVAQVVGLSDATSVQPVLVAVFDQRVDPEAVLATITLTAGDNRAVLELATTEQIEDDEQAARGIDAALDGRWVAFRPADPLPPAIALELVIGPATPSAEGTRTSTEASTHRGRTFDALEVTGQSCNYGGPCRPGTPFTVEFNNPIEPERFDPASVTSDPAIGGMRVGVTGSQMSISGATRGRTDYTITLPAELTDMFGQTLGQDTERTFKVEAAQTQLVPFARQFVTVDPMADRPGIAITSVNHGSVRVTAWRVDPDEVPAFQRYLESFYSDTDPADPAWPEVFDSEIDIDGDEDTAVETLVDLTDTFAESADGQLVVQVSPTREFDPDSEDYWYNRPTVAWVQATTLGIDAILDGDEILIWTTDLTTGEVRPGVEVELVGSGRTVTTDGNGVARTPLQGRVRGLLGRDETADGRAAVGFLASSWYQGWEIQRNVDEARWYVFDDRGIYKPGETVRVTGWIRRLALSGDAQLELYGDGPTVTWTAYDPMGNPLGDGRVEVNPLGGFNLSVELPDSANLGDGYIELQAAGAGISQGGAYSSHQFQIQDFRTPEFEVTARPESPAPYFVVEPATVAVDANYYAGGPLPDADVNWLVTSAQTTYRPPRWDQYNFGIWQPWWYGGFGRAYEEAAVSRGFAENVAFEGDIGCFGPDCPDGPTVEQFAGRTDGNGHHFLRMDFHGPNVDLPTTVTAEAQVTDVNRQVWASRTDLLVHPARDYVGLRTDRPFVQQGTPIRVDTVVTDVDGVAVPDAAVEVTAGRVDQVWANGEWTEEVVDVQTCSLTSVALDPATANSPDAEVARPDAMRCEFDTGFGGQYRLTAVVTDGDGRPNRSEMTVWVTGADTAPNRSVTQEQVTIVPDADAYAPGDTAQLLVQAPFAPASGLVTVSRGGIVDTSTFDAPDGSAVIDIGIEEAWIPNVTVQVDMVGTAVRLADDGTPQPDVPPRPAFATGQLNLPIPPVTRALDVMAEAADPLLEPGAGTSVTVTVTDADGRPVDEADVAVIVVDEAVLSLTGYQLTDPLDVFYGDVWSQIYAEYTRSGIVLNRSDLVTGNGDVTLADGGDGSAEEAATDDSESADLAQPTTTTAAAEGEALSRSGAQGADGNSAGSPPIAVRTDFSALALYAPAETTGSDGTVTVPVDLPDNLTRYRIMAVAIDGADRFGKGEGTITARLPLMVRPSAPRFLNFGDRFELPVVVQNQTDLPMDVDVVVEGSNLTLAEGAGRRVTVPANDRLEVRFPAAAEEAGTARFRVAGVGAVADAVAGSEADANDTADAALVELPVYTPATAEAFATYGVIDDVPGSSGEVAVGQPLTVPEGVFPQFGGLEITTSSTAVQALTDAVLYLHDYPYDSAEGYASRIMAVSTLRDVLDAFDAEGLPDPARLNAQVQRDIERLAALQNDDGGFPSWQRGQRSIPWTTIQATHALVLADDAGYRIPADTLSRAKERLGSIEALYPGDYGPEIRASLSAYALNVRHQAGDSDASRALDVYRERADVLQPDGLAWLWPVLTDTGARAEIERELTNRAVDTAGAATFANAYTEDDYVIAASDQRTDGIVLDALISEAPDSDLVPKVVAGLLGSQVRGRWNNVLENGFILVAMKHYFDTFEGVTPDFVARAWLGDDYLSAYSFQGRSTDRAFTLIPMDEVIAGGDRQLVVAKDGPGRLYYRLGLRYAPQDLVLPARDEGFVVDRIYEGSEPGDVTQDPDGTWRIKAGATVRVTLTMVADAARTHVALIDPLPAGLEPLNPALTVSATVPPPAVDTEGEGGDTVAPDDWCWCWQWYEHQNLRDDRAEAFASYLPGGTYTYTYTARATTPGEFVVPPSRAEEMYAPETFGRSSSSRVVVEK